MLIGSLKVLPASVLPAKNVSVWGVAVAEANLSSHVITTLLTLASMLGF